MNRRGFFSRFLSSNEIPSRIFFGLQIIFNESAKDGLRKDLHKILSLNKSNFSPSEKVAFYKQLSSAISDVFFSAEYGFWDYKISKDATSEYNSWLSELSAAIATEKEENGEEVDYINRASSDKNFIALSFIFLIEGSKTNESFYNTISSISDEEYFEKQSFIKITNAIRLIDFENTLGEAIFLVPGNDEDGLSWFDIHSEGWNYLKPIL